VSCNSRATAIALLLLASCRVGASKEPVEDSELEAPIVDASTDEAVTEPMLFEQHPLPPTSPSVPPRPWVRVSVQSVAPAEFSTLVRNHMPDDDALGECVLPEHPERTTTHGELALSYFIGPVARVASVSLLACEFSDPEICVCMSNRVARWRFPPHVQNVQVELRVRTRPAR
jgi:hypothetical protein